MTNWERYADLRKIYKIRKGIRGLVSSDLIEGSAEYKEALNKAIAKYDIVVDCVGVGYAHRKYKVLKNVPGVSTNDLAIICDDGYLPFGYRVQDCLIYVHTD